MTANYLLSNKKMKRSENLHIVKTMIDELSTNEQLFIAKYLMVRYKMSTRPLNISRQYAHKLRQKERLPVLKWGLDELIINEFL